MKKWPASFGVLAALVFIAFLMWLIPVYRVWEQDKSGEALLRHASQTRQVLIEQARAEKDAAKETAEAIEIVGAAAQKYPEWRQQEFIRAFANAIESGSVKMIFVPTEGNIPITEAGRTASP